MFFYLDVRKQPFYVPIDPKTISFEEPNPSYESSVLFMVTNFQYLVTCMSFSVAKPFRLPICTNKPFTACICILVLLGSLIVFLPDRSSMSRCFNLLPFSSDGLSFYDYRAWIACGIVLNCLLTYLAEVIIVNQITRRADER